LRSAIMKPIFGGAQLSGDTAETSSDCL
jgi:hypothetical protein